MDVKKVAAGSGLLGGVLWIVAAAMGWGDDPLTGTSDTLWLVGYGLFVLCSGLAGYSLVTGAPVWLRAVATFGAGALAASVVLSFAPELEVPATPVMVGGILLVLASGGALGLLTRTGKTT
jgi:hypothetical protein